MGMSRAAAVTMPAEAPPVWHILNLLAGLQAAAVGVDQLPQGDAHRHFHDLRGLHVADDLVDLGAGGVRGAQGFIPGPALVDDGRDAGQGLHVVDDGGLLPQTGHPGKGRLHAGIAPLAFDGFDERGFLAADVAAEPGADLDVKGKVGAEELVPQIAFGPGLLDGLYSDGAWRDSILPGT